MISKKSMICISVVAVFIAYSSAALARCIGLTELEGNWMILQGEQLFDNKTKALAIVQDLESGKTTLEALLKDQKEPSGFYGEMLFMPNGMMRMLVSMPQPNPPMTVTMKTTANWQLNCDKLMVQMVTIDQFDMVADEANVPADQRAQLKKALNDMKGAMKAQAEADPSFKEVQTSKLLFVGEKFMLTEENKTGMLSLMERK